MTLEMDFGEDEPKTLIQEIEFHRARMMTFMNTAREFARDADDVVVEHVKNKGAYRGSIVLAGRAAREDVLYKDAIAQQQMYDRWTMREATVVTALTNIALLEKVRDREARDSNIRLAMEGVKKLHADMRTYRDKIVRMLTHKKGL